MRIGGRLGVTSRPATVTSLALIGIFGLVALAGPGCAKRPTARIGPGARSGEAGGAPLVVVDIHREELPEEKVSIKLVARGEPSAEAATELLSRYVAEHGEPGREMWVALYLEGMDLQSVEYAIAIARPGEPPWITVRESMQTYR